RKGSYKNWRKLKQRVRGDYLTVKLRDEGGRVHTPQVHRIILVAFTGGPPKGKDQCCHFDGNRGNKPVEKLRWGDGRDQAADRVRHGTINRGQRAGRSRLTAEYVLAIRYRNEHQGEIGLEPVNIRAEAAKMGVSYQTIWEVLKYKTWRHIRPLA